MLEKDLANLKRRHEKEMEYIKKYPGIETIIELLPAISNMQRAISHTRRDKAWIEGATKVMQQFISVIDKNH